MKKKEKENSFDWMRLVGGVVIPRDDLKTIKKKVTEKKKKIKERGEEKCVGKGQGEDEKKKYERNNL